MTGTESNYGESSHRKGTELEKFKRRMIRSVARRMKEKKTDQELWEDMKKEIGSNCKKLWERMRMLTLKKLKRLLESDDRVDLIGPVARMTLTDWLLFDLVIVHEKIDVIDREKLTGNYHSKVLMNLFSLVQRFEIEGRTGENLAEAWTAATVYYNSKGHQCSPMMLQRRWYQIKELTRHKFYKFWFNYRGNQRQLLTAKLDSPDELQKAIALKYPQVITEKFLDWEEGIENRVVILPDELGVKMRQRNLMKASDTTAPDVVLVEPHIEVIDLGVNSDSEDEGEIGLQNVSETQTQPIVNIKSEPLDDEKDFEKEHNVYIPPEKGSEFDEEIQRLQMVEENFDDNAAQNGLDNIESIVIDPVPPINDHDASNTSNEGANETEKNENTFSTVDGNEISSFSNMDGEITNVKIKQKAIVIDDVESYPHKDATAANDTEIEAVISNDSLKVFKDSHIEETIDSQVSTRSDILDVEIGDDSNVTIAEISSIASAGVKVENVEDVLKSNITDNMDDELITSNIPELLPVISTVSSAGIKVEKDLAVRNDITVDSNMLVHNNIILMSNDTAVECSIVNFEQNDNISKILPEISAESSEDIKVEIETEIDENLHIDKTLSERENSPVVAVVPYEDDMNEPSDAVKEKDLSNANVNELDAFGDIPTDFNFADDGIDFADDGIAYVEEDEDDIITIRDLSAPLHSTNSEKSKEGDVASKNYEKDSSDEEVAENFKAQKFDLKLLMCPVVYTTKLEVMRVCDDTLQYKRVYDKELIDKIYTMSKPLSKQSKTESERVIEHKEGSNTSNVNDDQVEDKNYTTNVSDDDLFRNETIEESYDSDSESDIVDDSKRVKLTSYMLHKPKHRSYNPVLLCKNPDFNTRLKKLPVGFFMSARNRTLLQSCIPMTIDMTKAFEDKLINGTLYLKPTPTDSVIKFQDDVEVTSAELVQPTAVQQSLMSIDDTLESEMKKRMAERIRAINLPDISQVRRLNQHLLTAEVTPLRLENEVSQDDAKQIGPENYVENIKNDIDNLLAQQKAKDTNIEPVIIEEESPPPLVYIKSPLSKALHLLSPAPPPITIISPVTDSILPHPPPQIVHNNTAPSIKTTNVEDSNRSTAKVRKQSRKTYYPPLAWNQRPNYQNQVNQEFHKDALLTIDTLYKMLSALDPCTNLDEYLPKKKAYKKKIVDTWRKNGETSNENKTDTDTVIDITDDEIAPVKKPRPISKLTSSIRTKDKQYCCFYRYRIEYIQGNVCKPIPKRRHRCRVNNCTCCCRELCLRTFSSVNKEAIVAIEVEHEPQTEKHISQTIEHVVHDVNAPKSKADFSIQIDMDENYSQVESLPDSLSSHDAVLTQNTDTTVDDTSLTCNYSDNGAAELTPLHPSKDHHPTPKIRVYSGASHSQSVTKSNADLIDPSNTRPNINEPYSRNKLKVVLPPPSLSIKPVFMKPKTHVKGLKSPGILPNLCTCRPNISQVNKGRIEINGSNNCKLHKKQIKESKLLAKKLITDENQPFFVGKGKILLTNLKMPRKSDELESQSQEQTPPTPQPEEVQSIRLPAGVQIVLLPDQTLTYVLEPDITLTPEEYAVLPEFLVAIQQQLNSDGITLPADHPVAKTAEIIDLDKDEFPCNPNSDTLTNTDSVLNLTEPIKSIPTPELNDESTSGETIALKTVEDFEVEIDSLAKEKRATHEDFEEKIDILAVENKISEKFGENIKEIEKTQNQISKINEFESSNAGNSIVNPVPDKAENMHYNSPISISAEEPTNKKSLLSDLMEMSGIMEEDLAPPPLHVITPPEPIIIDTSNFILQRRVSPQEAVTNRTVAVPSQSPVTPKEHYTVTNKTENFELTAVTSFADLKYSSDNNGLFFKLDLETGQLTSINVCIQKFSSSLQQNPEKSIIDLTDDPDIHITGTVEDGSKSPAPSIISINERSPPKKTPMSTIIQKKQRLMERLSNNLKPINIAQSKRHVAKILRRNKSILREPVYSSEFKLQKILTKIDLVDSDAPMEEEYLVSDDSSDDEPLIKKSKRIHSETPSSYTEPDQTIDKQSEEPPLSEHESLEQQQNAHAQQDQTNLQQYLAHQEQSNLQKDVEEQEQSNIRNSSANHLNEHIEEHLNEQDQDQQDLDRDSCSQGDDFIDKESQLDEEMDDLNHIAPMPVPTNLVLSGGALNAHNIPLNNPYRQAEDSENSDEDENCILGV